MPAPDGKTACVCESGLPYGRCCGLLHQGHAASSALALMRSRYAAYVLGFSDYLLATWHSTTRPARLDLVADETKTRWLGLRIVENVENIEAGTAEVEFIVRYRVGGGRAERMQERSRFVRENGRWVYLEGSIG